MRSFRVVSTEFVAFTNYFLAVIRYLMLIASSQIDSGPYRILDATTEKKRETTFVSLREK